MTTTSAAHALGPAYEAGLERARRHRDGVFYTPEPVADGLVRVAAEGLDLGPTRRPTVWDPAVGGGAFLLAAAALLADVGHDPRTIVDDLVWGTDVDAGAVAVTRAALRSWAAERGAQVDGRHVVVADGLTRGRASWPDAPAGGFDLVVGNPPFQNQLERGTTRTAARLAELRDHLGPIVTPYADTAALFLVEACRAVAPGGRVALVLPESVLAARDAGPARAAALERCVLAGFWWAGEQIFDAGVDVCAPVLVCGGPASSTIERWSGPRVAPAPPVVVDPHLLARGGSWSALLVPPAEAQLFDPNPVPGTGRTVTLGTVATATAGFRDQFYGIVPYVVEAAADGAAHVSSGELPARARLMTSGLVDPLRSRWGSTTARFAGRRWEAPLVDIGLLTAGDPSLAGWGSDRLVPKVVLATQTRVLEPAVDCDGGWWPSVPTIAVTPTGAGPADLWAIAAVLAAPPVSAWALAHYRGSALARDAIKLSASQVLAVPLPDDAGAWAEGAARAEQAHHAAQRDDAHAWQVELHALGAAMTEAYSAPRSMLDWWIERLPAWR